MKIQIRKSVFETNSSSTHAMVISNSYDYAKLPNKVIFEPGEFGWEQDEYTDTYYLGSYLFTLMVQLLDENTLNEELNKIGGWFVEDNIEFEYSPFHRDKEYNCVEFDNEAWFYVDHCDGAEDFMWYCLESKEHLYNFLFGNDSIIFTGNDNDDDSCICYSDIQPRYSNNIIFYKGN